MNWLPLVFLTATMMLRVADGHRALRTFTPTNCEPNLFPWSDWTVAYGQQNLHYLGDGALRISMDWEGNGVRLRSNNQVHYGVIRFEAKFDTTPGAISTFYGSSERSNMVRTQQEIDVEIISASPAEERGTLWANVFYDGKQPAPSNLPPTVLQERTGDPELSLANWNKYEIHWATESISWYINGKLVHTTPNGSVRTPEKKMWIFISIWAGNDGWGGKLDVPKGTMMYSYYRDVVWDPCGAVSENPPPMPSVVPHDMPPPSPVVPGPPSEPPAPPTTRSPPDTLPPTPSTAPPLPSSPPPAPSYEPTAPAVPPPSPAAPSPVPPSISPRPQIPPGIPPAPSVPPDQPGAVGTPPPPEVKVVVPTWGQCGGAANCPPGLTCGDFSWERYSYACLIGSVCTRSNEFYYQCLPVQPAPPPPGSTTIVVPVWGQCGGVSACPQGHTCGDFNWERFDYVCNIGSVCTRSNEFYYQCLPVTTNPSPPSPPPVPPVYGSAPPPADTVAVPVWGQCGGMSACPTGQTCGDFSWERFNYMCATGGVCTRSNAFYYQCLPAPVPPPPPQSPAHPEFQPPTYPAPPTAGDAVVPSWGQCGGIASCPSGQMCGDFSWERFGYTCKLGSVCTRSNEFYYQCLPVQPAPPPPGSTTVVVPVWGQCGGIASCPHGKTCGDFSWERFEYVCNVGSVCTRSSESYYQCLPQ